MPKSELTTLTVEQLCPGRYQPREHFSEEALAELSQSIASNGLVQPLVVRPVASGYEIVAGERRWRAAQLAGLTEVDCLIKHYTDDQALEVAMIENINRVDLNPIEEANAYQRLCDEFHYSHEEIAAAIGCSRTKISNLLRLLQLSDCVQQYIINNRLTEGHGKVLAGLSATEQRFFADKVVSRGLSVRRLEQLIRQHQQAKANQNNEDANLRHLGKALGDYLGSEVGVQFANGKGQITIDFHNLDILQGVFRKMGFEYE